MVSINLQTGSGRVLLERGDDLGMVVEQLVDRLGGLVAAAQPHDSRRRPEQRCHIGKVRVLRNEREAVALGIVPKGVIIGFWKTEQSNLT